MAGGFFKNVGADMRQLIEGSFIAKYKSRFTFFDETFKYTYTRSNGAKESQIYTYKSLMDELQKKNINIADIEMHPAESPTMFGIILLTCLFKNGENPPTIIHIIPRNLESVMDDISRMMDEV